MTVRIWEVSYGINSDLTVVAKDIDEALVKARERLKKEYKNETGWAYEANTRISAVVLLASAPEGDEDE